jgi:hypothetical protein
MSDRRWLGCVTFGVILAALPVIVYVLAQFGYCHNWWGKENLRLRSWWLCRCPPEFEQSLYPVHIEVMYSACLHVGVRPITDGRYLLIRGDDNFLAADSYVLDPLTGQKEPFIGPQGLNSFDFLSPGLLLYRPQYQYATDGTYHLFNRHNSQLIPFKRSPNELIPEPYEADDSLNPELIALFEAAEAVYVWDQAETVLLLEAGWKEERGDILLLYENQFSGVRAGWIQAALDAGNIRYTNLDDWIRARWDPKWGVVSPDGRYIARPSGVYDTVTDKLVIGSPNDVSCTLSQDDRCYPGYIPCCWVADSQTVIYDYDSTIPTSFSMIDEADLGAPARDPGGSFWMPVLKVHLP